MNSLAMPARIRHATSRCGRTPYVKKQGLILTCEHDVSDLVFRRMAKLGSKLYVNKYKKREKNEKKGLTNRKNDVSIPIVA